MALLRAGAEVVGYEVRADFAAGARSNVSAFEGPGAAYRVEERDIYQGISERDLDRIVLDLPEPWRALGPASKALRPGGILLSYLPSITQVATLRANMASKNFGMAETFEVLRRTWHVEERSVRPDHRMVAHTGFITTARLLVPTPETELPDDTALRVESALGQESALRDEDESALAEEQESE